MIGRSPGALLMWAALAATTACGCRSSQAIREPEFAQLGADRYLSWQNPNPAAEAVSPHVPELAGPHRVDTYIRFALTQNPEIQAARLRAEALAHRIPQAASLPDPMLGVTVYAEPVQTAAGQQELALNASQKVPWFGKLDARAQVAAEEVNVARAELVAKELEVIERVKLAYFQLYYLQQALEILDEERQQLQVIEAVVDRAYRVQRRVTQQDLLAVQVDLSKLQTEQIELRQQLQSTQARLARELHISPETEVRALRQVERRSIPQDVQRLYERAVASRPELHAVLAEVSKHREASNVARLDYYPDVTWGVTWIDTSTAGLSNVANGRDAVLLGMSLNLPIYHKRLDAGVRENETLAVASARKYDALKDQTQQSVKDLFSKIQSQRELLQVFDEDLIPKAQLTLERSIAAYQVGEVEFLSMLDNWRKLLRFELLRARTESDLQQSLASLARIVGSYELAPRVPRVPEGIPPGEGVPRAPLIPEPIPPGEFPGPQRLPAPETMPNAFPSGHSPPGCPTYYEYRVPPPSPYRGYNARLTPVTKRATEQAK